MPTLLLRCSKISTLARIATAVCMVAVTVVFSGCGSAGYPGGGIGSLSTASFSIDSGQSYPVTATTSGGLTATWTLSGTCGSNCGTLSSSTGNTITYTAPAGLTAPVGVTLTAAISGTSNTKVVSISANPLPTLAGNPPPATVGVPYTTTITASGGSAPLTLSLAGTLPPGLTFNAQTGVISGTPTAVGTYGPTATVIDSSVLPAKVSAIETIVVTTPSVTPLTLRGNPPAGTVGTTYSSTLTATGGTGPYTFATISGALPTGLMLSATGVISGTPTTPGIYNFTAQVTDSTGSKSQMTFAVTIVAAGAPVIISSPPAGMVGQPYTGVIPVSGGTGPYTCTINSQLPAGLTANNCTLSGTPTTPGTTSVSVTATDSGNPKQTTTSPVSVVINPTPLTLTTGMLPSGTVQTPYSSTIGVSGGTGPYSCTLVSGTLQTGLTLGSNCLVSGTPTVAGTVSLMVKATDAGNPQQSTTGPVSLTINPAPLTVGSGTLPPATVGAPYTAPIPVSGGTGPYACVQTSGTLEPGLTLNPNCTITGTPTAPGTVSIGVKATDGGNPAQTATGMETVVVSTAALTITTGTLPSGTVQVPYSQTIGVTGGAGPYSCTIVSGTLQAGLTLGANCLVSGTPTAAGTVNLQVMATDASSPQKSTTGPVSLTINPAALAITTGTLPAGTVQVPYSQTIGVSGGTSPYSCTIVSGTLQAGLTLGTNCLVSGTPTVAGTVNLQVKATDAGNPQQTTTGPVSLTINPATLVVTTGTLPTGTVGVPYNAPIPVSGGTGPYSCVQTSGTLEAGLTLNANCTVSGTPTAPGTVNIGVKATDGGNPAQTATGTETVTINPAPLAITTGTLPNGTVGVAYSQTIGVSGGTGPYSCTIVSGTLQAGLMLGPNCLVSGTPTAAGTTNLQVKATDSSNPQLMTTGPVSLTINPATLIVTTGSLPTGTVGVPYNAPIPVSGGTGPYTCAQTSGTLEPGLTLNANCTVTGTPTAPGTVNIGVKATDSGNPAQTATGTETVTINPAPLVVSSATLPSGTVGQPYSAPVAVSGGTGPYSCTLTGGTLQAGLTLGTNCTISGTPTAPGTTTVTVTATDSGNPQQTASGMEMLTVNTAALAITTGTLPSGTVSVPYSQTIGVSGGTGPYSCTIVSGTLQAGLTLGPNCLVSGTPTASGTVGLQVMATDSSNPQKSVTGPVSLTINPAPATLTIGTLPDGTVQSPYNATIPVSGGTGPYSCTIPSNNLPAGLTLGANCAITGTPTTPGTTNLTVTATDSSNPMNTKTTTVPITINTAPVTLTLGTLPTGTVQTPYTGTIPVTGGTGPYTCTLTGGTLPAGLSINNCTITGTTTVAGTTPLQITAKDGSNPQGTVSGPVNLTINPLPPLTFTGTLANGVVGVPYTQTLAASGGLAPYTYAITAGALPAGLTLNTTTGVVSGTPTTPGASSLTVTATDSENPTQSVALPLLVLIRYPTTPQDAALTGPFAYLFQGYDDVTVGVLAFQAATAASFTADGVGGISAGELDSNHQGSSSATNQISSRGFLGTYTLGANYRGSLTITLLNANGTTGNSITYAIEVKTPVAPATTTAQGSLIEFDGDQTVGTKGSATLLPQTAASFASALNGSFAFGMSGDTPCLPSCTIGVIAGPAASTGEFTTNGAGALTNGNGDSIIATTNFTNSTLTGTYGAADSNGRLILTLATSGQIAGVYPTHFVVYMLDATHAFILSSDVHSAFILQAGTITGRQTAFANASLIGPFIGYENSYSNPGVLGTTIQNTLNFSTATVFRATGAGDGTCNVTNVNTGGTTALVNNLTGLGGSLTGLTNILAAYSQTGATSCATSALGRGFLQYPEPTALGVPLFNAPAPRLYYLTSPGSGYFIETSYAGLGRFEAQTGAPFTLANTFTGTYVYGMSPASSLATVDTDGIIASHGNGTATTTFDRNVGVGTINVLQLGTTMNTTYSTPDATTGIFTLGSSATTLIYSINPDRFVLLDTDAVNTSPSVAVLY